jgi:hypothetical protein
MSRRSAPVTSGSGAAEAARRAAGFLGRVVFFVFRFGDADLLVRFRAALALVAGLRVDVFRTGPLRVVFFAIGDGL